MKEIRIGLPSESWGRILVASKEKEAELRGLADKVEGPYKEVILLEAAEFSAIANTIEVAVNVNN